MNLATRILRLFGGLLILLAYAGGAAHAADLSQAVMLVATERLAGSGYDKTVLVATPLPTGEHIGFIVNRPTEVKLATLFPEHAPSRTVVDPVYFGGPLLTDSLFAVARQGPDGGGDVIALMPGLILAMDGDTVERVIETMPNDARYFAGLMVWQSGELDDQIRSGAWEVRPADAETVFRANPTKLWEELHHESRASRSWTSARQPRQTVICHRWVSAAASRSFGDCS